jgi:hypothetical protein
MSPSYNYNFKRQTAVQSATNIQNNPANKIQANIRNSPSSRLTGSAGNKGAITNLSRQSPVSRIQTNNIVQRSSPSQNNPKTNNIFIPNNPGISGAAGRISPAAQRYPTQKQKNVSPGTRYNSYMSGRGNITNQGTTTQQVVNKEFSDKHINKGSDLDSRLDKL